MDCPHHFHADKSSWLPEQQSTSSEKHVAIPNLHYDKRPPGEGKNHPVVLKNAEDERQFRRIITNFTPS